LARQPEVAETTLNYAGDTVRVVADVPLDRGFANSANGCAGVIAFTDFIRCSSNQYAAELLVRSLRADGYRPTGDDGIVAREVLERSAVGEGLAEAFDVDALGFRTAGRNPGLWAATNRSGARTDRTLLPWESRPWLLFPETEGTRLDLLARYAFGGWENRWTLLGLGEAYARIATGREVRARIVSDSSGAAEMPANVANAFRRVRVGLRQVPMSGTAAGLASDVSDALGREVTVMAKTGTLNERRDRFRSLALVVGQTPLAQGTATSSRMTGASAPLSCGLVAVSWFEFHDGVERPSSLPSVHLDFARDEFASVLSRHWDRVSGCESAMDGPGAME
ncbi:MAG TPA: hypothetical protein VHG09_14800, partial [Longimicrobiales bacterium]|nr:hypothetical protein [Longimicrobiales bacterium]